jgi:hypothetical protein
MIIKVIDNFFEDPESIRNYALKANYRSPGQYDWWKGFRSNILDRNVSIENFIIERIEKSLFEIFDISVKSEVYFHRSPKIIMSEMENFHKYKYHKDISDCAGVIYLTPNPPENSGTCILGVRCVENVYNRFLTYPGDLIHGPDHLFGNNLLDERLTITFFSNFL